MRTPALPFPRHLTAAAAFAVSGLAAGACAPPRASATPTPAAPSAPLEPRAALRVFVDSLVAAPEWRNAHWGILVVNPYRGDTLYSRNAGKLFMPASNMKIVTGTVALAQLGPDYRFQTAFGVATRDGGPAIEDGVLQGDLVVTGSGDPTISDHAVGDAMAPLLAAADSLRARGVRRIAGRVLPGPDRMPGPVLGFGWAWDDLDYPYSAGVDELYFNEGFSRVLVRGGAHAGDVPQVTVRPATTYPLATVRAVTGPVGTKEALEIQGTATGGALLTGTIAPGDSAELEVAHRDPQAAFLAALREALERRGITIADPATAPFDSTRVVTPLFTLTSPPLREIMPLLEKPSQNQIAELLLRTLGLEGTGVGSADSGRAVVERQLAAWGAEPDGYVIRDGSGLSRHDYLTPETIVRVLARAQQDTAFAVFYHALPIAGVDGTIANRMKGTPAQGNVHAKTGFIDKARSLSGYVTTADGTLLIFSFLANNWTTPTREVERVQDAIAAHLAAMQLRPVATP
ncbi:MAG TPA: D-alanyl-D-alanine carboxypeptidase/D-alanyl-D-alanine-endopeptidase [Gemmatimonadaceae bacterium]|nr:D-alanyl-D-alanine carboxypeptidase/D-alanyl-D-alanine-endopeptidase [Gemmatimonadaceae bacterium]